MNNMKIIYHKFSTLYKCIWIIILFVILPFVSLKMAPAGAEST